MKLNEYVEKFGNGEVIENIKNGGYDDIYQNILSILHNDENVEELIKNEISEYESRLNVIFNAEKLPGLKIDLEKIEIDPKKVRRFINSKKVPYKELKITRDKYILGDVEFVKNEDFCGVVKGDIKIPINESDWDNLTFTDWDSVKNLTVESIRVDKSSAKIEIVDNNDEISAYLYPNENNEFATIFGVMAVDTELANTFAESRKEKKEKPDKKEKTEKKEKKKKIKEIKETEENDGDLSELDGLEDLI